MLMKSGEVPALEDRQVTGSTAVGPVLFELQVVDVKLGDVLPLGEHTATGTEDVLLVVQVVAIQLGALAVTGVQVATGFGPLKVVGAQVVATQELPLVALEPLQLATKVGPVGLIVQVVAFQPLPAMAATGTQLAAETPVGPVVVMGQVVAV